MIHRLLTLLIVSLLSLSCAVIAHADEAAEPPLYYGEIVRLDASDPDGDLERRLDAGAIYINRRGDLALLYIPYDAPREESTRSGDSYRKHGPLKPKLKATPTMDVALPLTWTDRIHSGAGLPQGYDGEGVVVGFCDTGFDPGHLNFRDSEGKCRVSRMVIYKESSGERHVYSTPEEILAAGTDDADKWHATHVAGILAGSYPVEGIPEVKEGSRIIGAAPGAEIVATTSELSEAGLLGGVEDIIAYAAEIGKPAVVNLSVGNYIGPHDGSSLFCQYLDLCAEDAIICISAGNEGKKTNHQFSSSASTANPMRIRIAGADWVNLTLYGQTDIYSADSTPFDLSLRISDSTLDTEDSFIYQTPPLRLSRENTLVISSADMPEIEEWNFDEIFARYFDGEVYVEGGIDPENGRWYASVMYDCTTEEIISEEKHWARYRLEFVITPVSSVRVDAFADGQNSWLSNWHGNPSPPGNSMSISDLATGFRTVSAGMYCTGQTSLMMNGKWNFTEYETPYRVTAYSSYGTLSDGRTLPLTVGPGMTVVSSMSGPHVADYGTDECSIAVKDPSGDSYYWAPMSGTSMSSPFVAGCVATWLQAEPSLTWRDVQDIIAETNFFPDVEDVATNPRYANGLFDPYAGLLRVLDRSGVTGTSRPGTGLEAKTINGMLHILNPSGSGIMIEAFSLQGQLIGRLSLRAGPSHKVALEELNLKPGEPVIVRISSPTEQPLALKLF